MPVKEKWKGKDWYQILTPSWAGDIVIGETPAMDAAALKGRIVEVSMMDLTGDPGKYYINVFFKVIEVSGNKATTAFAGHEVTRDFIARAVQTRTTRIDTNDVVDFKDGRLRLKTVVITNRLVPVSIAKALRAAVSSTVTTLAKDMPVENFVKEMSSDSIQAGMRDILNKIYPVRLFEFRKSEVLA